MAVEKWFMSQRNLQMSKNIMKYFKGSFLTLFASDYILGIEIAFHSLLRPTKKKGRQRKRERQ